LHWAGRILGLPRFLGQHPGGLIITNQPIGRHAACEWSGGDGVGAHRNAPLHRRLITQVDMHSGIDALGLIKFDLLGNGSLSVLRDALEEIRRQGLPDPEVWDLEKCQRDPVVQDLMVTGRARGVFYLESPAQMRLNQKAGTRTFDEIAITSSLVRPAGTAYAMTFVERHRQMKQGRADWEFLHPSLKPILKETQDVCAFQEDVTKICHYVAGLSYKKADAVRNRMNSQHEGDLAKAEFEELTREFVDGCQRTQGLTGEQARELWKRVCSFTGFSFCKSHSASYAQLSFQCAYLKVHYPAAFLAAVISNNHGFYRREVYLNEARRWGLRVLPANVNHSEIKYRGMDRVLIPGFLHLRGLSKNTLGALLAQRQESGPFSGLEDFLRRVPAGRAETENLILAGAFDGMGLTQPEHLFLLDGLREKIRSEAPSLFGSEGRAARADLPPGLGEYSLMRRCLNEQNLFGYMLSGNPLDVLEVHPASKDAVLAADLPAHKGRRVKVIGYQVTERMHAVEKNGRLMKFLTLEDRSAVVDVIFWPDALERFEEALWHPGPFEIWGKVTEDWGTFSLEAQDVRPVAFTPHVVDFELASARLRAGMEARIHGDAAVAQVA
jgi:DNA polymerase III alpha subunit